MYLKNLIMLALITALFACPFTNSFVSEYFANNHTGELEESKRENSIIDEGTLIAAYNEPENTFGDGILDISDCGAALNTVESSGADTMESAEDIATGEESGILAAAQGKNDTSKRYDANTTVGEKGINGTKGDKSSAAGTNNYDSNIVGNTDGKKEADNNNAGPLAGNGNGGIDAGKTSAASSQPTDSKASTASSQPADSKASTASSQPADSKASTASSQPADSKASTASSQPADSKASTAPGQPAGSKDSTAPSQSSGSNASAAPSQPVANNVNNGEDNSGNVGSATNSGTEYGETYRHNTSIYSDDNSLIRVEYYDDDNHLYEYSEVTDYSGDTGSYTETVYRYDEENDVDILVRKDTYVNGVLVSSE